VSGKGRLPRDETTEIASGIGETQVAGLRFGARVAIGRGCRVEARRMIELRELQKVFPGPDGKDVVAVTGVNLSVETGETIALIGTSGCGKTTTLKMINRLIDPTAGAVLLNGKDVRETNLIKLRRNIGYVVQRGGLFPHMTVARNVALLCHLDKWPKQKTRQRAFELLEMVNLPPEKYAGRYPHELSGGERQRVGVARSLAYDPEFVLMDEPFGALDPITRDKLHAEFLQLDSIVKKTIVIVTHDMAEAFKLAHRVALMHRGELVQIGTEQDFRDRPATEFVQQFLSGHLAPDVADAPDVPDVPELSGNTGSEDG
jgi:osmoprotectant transport system ATP-binding protein